MKSQWLSLIALFSLAVSAYAQQSKPASELTLSVDAQPSKPAAELTLPELEQMAQQNNPTLAQAAARVEAARAQWVQVGLYPNPVVGYLGSEIGDSHRAGQQGGFLSQEVVTAKKLQWNQSVACQEIRQAEFACEAQRHRVLTDVRRTYFDVLVAQRRMELSEQLVHVGEEGTKAAEELMKAKEVARCDVLQAKIELDSARILLEKAKNRYQGGWRTLAAVVGDATMKPVRLAGNLQDGVVSLNWEETLTQLLTHSPQLSAARAGVERAQAALGRECAGRVPNVDVQVSTQYDNATGDTMAGVQLGVPIPFYNRNQGNIRRAQAELTAVQNDVKRIELELQQRLAAVFEQYDTARYQVEKYTHDIVPNAQASLQLILGGYRQGEFSYIVLLTAQRTYFQANLACLDALGELRAAAALIEGNLLADSLQTAESSDRGAKLR